MTISLDYDGTYTRDPALWQGFCELASAKGHTVILCTMRSHQEGVDEFCHRAVSEVFFTDRKSKKEYLHSVGVNVDIWIDDQPFFIYQNG